LITSLFTRIGQTRTRLKPDHALIAPDSHVISTLPAWNGATGVVVLSPAIGARLAQTLVFLEPTAEPAVFLPTPGVEVFLYVLEGGVSVTGGTDLALRADLAAGGYGFHPADTGAMTVTVTEQTRLLLFEKRYVPAPSANGPGPVSGRVADVEGKPFMGDPDARLQVLLPETAEFDMAVNIFTYQSGASLPFAETHIMEHGLLMLEGEGIYRLNECWYPVAAGDSIWMASYCPQWFAAFGKTQAAYIYYKDVHRDSMI